MLLIVVVVTESNATKQFMIQILIMPMRPKETRKKQRQLAIRFQPRSLLDARRQIKLLWWRRKKKH